VEVASQNNHTTGSRGKHVQEIPLCRLEAVEVIVALAECSWMFLPGLAANLHPFNFRPVNIIYTKGPCKENEDERYVATYARLCYAMSTARSEVCHIDLVYSESLPNGIWKGDKKSFLNKKNKKK